MRPVLPIDRLLPEIAASFSRHPNLVLQASPGSGKTTRVPPFLLDHFSDNREILVLVPRRLAAKLAAYRVAEEWGEKIGERVGYHFRFEKVLSQRTRLQFLTEGMLLRRLLSEPQLPKVAMVILDEFHERHLHSDVALAYLRRLQMRDRSDLKLLVMSATLQAEALAQFLGAAPVLRLEQPLYPVELLYRSFEKNTFLDRQVSAGVGEALRRLGEERGDVLVFLPGMADIRRAESALQEKRHPNSVILPLHGELPREEQAKVFQPYRERKIILATNVAESSLTIDGVRAVVDSGLHRQASFSWWSGIPLLKTKTISQASAIQRAGRAGRTAAGIAIRLYSQAEFQGRPAFDPPEIRRVDLAQCALELKALVGNEFGDFRWFEDPPPGAWRAALDLLYALGALKKPDFSSLLTEVGRRMAKLPLHPRLARILLEGEQRKILMPAARLVAKLSEGEIDTLDATEMVRKPCGEAVRRMERSLLSEFPSKDNQSPSSPWESELARAALFGFPDRVAKRRATSTQSVSERQSAVAREYDLVFSTGGSGTVNADPVLADHSLFLVLDVQERSKEGQKASRLQVRSLLPLEEEHLLEVTPPRLQESCELFWDTASARVWELDRLRYDAIVLEEKRRKPEPSLETLKILLNHGLGLSWERLQSPAFSLQEFFQSLAPVVSAVDLEANLVRRRLLTEYFPDIPGKGDSEQACRDQLFEKMQLALGLEELRTLALAEASLEDLPPEWLAKLPRLLPERLSLPGGRQVKVHYQFQKNPWIESRLQDFFGLLEGPKLLEGRLPVTVHLLAPNQRALQVTQDLKNFWKTVYPELRGQLSRRYPRHAWPEDPSKAKPPEPRPKGKH